MIEPAAVARQTFAPPGRADGRRRYHSPLRRAQVEATREAFVEAVLRWARKGVFRADVHAICAVAGYSRRTLEHQYGAVPLLYRVVARERWADVVPLLPFDIEGGRGPVWEAEARAAVWAVLVGEPRALP